MSSGMYQGKYEQLNLIGKGKYGIIYRIKSLSDGKEYVAKHISLDQIQQNVAKKQLQIIQRLRHPYIVEYVDSFTYGQDFIIIMEYCKQKDLAHHIQLMRTKNKHFNQNLVVTWLFQLVLGMQFIHSKKILHRDIKPQNIFIDENLNIKIGDFGISKILASTGDHCKTLIGTPYYLAPQICNEQKYTSKADIWSLGCVIYQICALQRPFKSAGIFQLIEQIKIGKIKDITNAYSQDLRNLVMKMLIRDQSKRPNTTQLLKDPVLVDLMIKNSSSMSLKKQYSRNIQKPNTLSQSFIDKQTNLVYDQLKIFEQEVKAKMGNLKKKEIGSVQVDKHYMDLKDKMAQIQSAIGKAFSQLKKKTKPQSSIKFKQDLSQKNSSGLTDSSDMTIIESIVIGESKKSGSGSGKKQQKCMVSSASYESVPMIQTKKSLQFGNNSSGELSQSIIAKGSSRIQNSQSLGLNSKVLNDRFDESSSMQQTLLSQYQKTTKQSTLAKQTIQKLDFLQKTLTQNPDAILNGSLLNFTLTMSEDQLRKSLNLGKVNPTNSLSLKLRSDKSLDETINFDLTKRQSDSLGQSLDKAFKKKQTSKSQKSQKNSQKNLISVPNIQQNSGEEQQDYYNQEFQEYESDEEDSQQNLQFSKVGLTKQRRKSELNTIISFYQQTLHQINNQSEMNDSNLSPTQKVKNKYPLVMSEIKEQTGQSGSILSKNNNSSNNNSMAF